MCYKMRDLYKVYTTILVIIIIINLVTFNYY